jgi:demethoxyubiquinone hydroxylase (CLK1/Coq7/Cat5 family)
MIRRVALVRTEVSEERIAYVIRVTRIGELGATLTLPSNRRTLRSNTMSP